VYKNQAKSIEVSADVKQEHVLQGNFFLMKLALWDGHSFSPAFEL